MASHPSVDEVPHEHPHLSRVIVQADDTVGKGQLPGYSGKSGAATGAHQHFGFIPMGNVNLNNRMRGRIDPWPYLEGGITAAGIITKLQELTMATLDLDDLKAVQGIVQSERSTIVNEVRFGFSELSKALKHSTFELKVWDQVTDNQTGDRVINDGRAQEQATRDQLGADRP